MRSAAALIVAILALAAYDESVHRGRYLAELGKMASSMLVVVRR